MNENEMPEWAKKLNERIDSIGEKLDKTFPEERKKPDFSKLRAELDLNDVQVKKELNK